MSYELQILHASDLEGGVDAIDRAPNFAALIDLLEDQVDNSITISSGDNVIPGPFFNAALFVDDVVFNDAINDLRDLTGDDVYAALEGGRGRIDISVMNAIGFDASALGNHEFDTGTDTLGDFALPDLGDATGVADDEWTGTLFPYLSANLDFSGDGSLADAASDTVLTPDQLGYGIAESDAGTDALPRFAPGAILEENGERIGVVGATTQLLSSISSPGNVEVETGGSNDMQALAGVLQPVIDEMRDQGVNKIVVASHLQQIALEEELAGLLSGVDVILAGGSDTLLADQEDVDRGLQAGDTPDRAYPILTENADGEPVAITSTDGEYSYVGRLVLTFDDDGVLDPDGIDPNVSGAFATTEAVLDQVSGDTDPFAEGSKGAIVRDLVGSVESVVDAQDGNTFGETDVFLEGRREAVRTEETNLGNLTADANLAAAQAVDPSVLVSIKNGGGIRAQIGDVGGTNQDPEFLAPQGNPDVGKLEGEVSQLDITNSLRFNNGLTLQTLTHAQLVEVLEHGVAESGDGNTPGQFAQVGGVNFSYDLTREPGDRIETAAVVDENGTVVAPLVSDGTFIGDPNAEIRIVTLGFLQGGGDDYPFAQFADELGERANVVDLEATIDTPGRATFTDAGSEQDALAEYLAAQFGESPYRAAETDPSGDTRIQNLAARDDTVMSQGQVFDEARYLANNPDVAAAVAAGNFADGRAHYDAIGWLQGLDPNAFFDTSYYLRQNPDVAAAGVNPFTHYLNRGAIEDRDPSAIFDASDYLSLNPDVAATGLNPLVHFLRFGLEGGRYNQAVQNTARSDVTNGDDVVRGNGGDNLLRGLDGNDVLIGQGGDDTLLGGRGRDTTSYQDAAGGVQVDLGAGTASGSDANDTLISIENATGSMSDDMLMAGVGFSELRGLDGDDFLSGGFGPDRLIGNAGTDTAGYTGAGAGVRVDLEAGTARGGDGPDTLFSIERVLGSNFRDTLYGDSGDNTLRGQANDDRIDGRGGNDFLFGDGGADLFMFSDEHGVDTIGGFESGVDRIDLNGVTGFNDFGDVTDAATDEGGRTVIATGESSEIRLPGVALADLTAADFVLAPQPGDLDATQVGRFETGVFAEGAAEIVAHDPDNQRLFVTNGDAGTLDVLDVSDPANITRTQQLSPGDLGLAAGAGFNHVEVMNGIVAVAVEADTDTGNGQVLFMDADDLSILNTVEVGVLPDNLAFSPDGTRVVTANEGEQFDDDEDGTPEADPQGSVSIIDISGGVASATVQTLDFTAFNDQRAQLVADGVRLAPGRTVADDLEPEYVAISPDGTEARVALQENNALAVVDLENGEITGIQPLGTKDFSQPGNGLDAINDGEIDIETLPVRGLYQPDQIAAFEAEGQTYYATADEGDDRDFDVSEGDDLIEDDLVDAEAQEAIEDNNLGELEFSNIDGDTDDDGQIDQLTIFGGRSFSILDADGNRVFNSGDEFARVMAEQIPNGFNSDDEENDFDSESDEAGAEVEGITTGMIDGQTFAFIGLEKPGGVMIYDVTDPANAEFVNYINNRDFDVDLTNPDGTPNPAAGDSGPEGLEFVSAEDSPSGVPLLVVGNEVSGTVTLYELM